MAIGNFNPETSIVANSINKLTSKEIFERYFIRGKKSDWESDSDEVLNTLKDNEFVHPLTVSLQGKLLNSLLTKFEMKIKPFIPDGYKLNAKQIFADLEKLFAENPNEIRKSIFSDRFNDFAKDRIYFVLDSCNRGLEYILTNNVD